MATKTIIELMDDLDGAAADETVTFSLDGVNYEVDLSAKNATVMRGRLETFVSAARRVRSGSRTPQPAAVRRDPAETQAIREWAKASGYSISDRGRISLEIVAAYEAAPSA